MCNFIDFVIEITNVKVSKLFSHSPHIYKMYLSTFPDKLFASVEKPFGDCAFAVEIIIGIVKIINSRHSTGKLLFGKDVRVENVNKS